MTKLYKFNKLDTYKISSLASNTLWFSNLEEFNDPFEGRVRIVFKKDSNEDIITAFKNILALCKKKGIFDIPPDLLDNDYSEEDKKHLLNTLKDFLNIELQDLSKIAACCFIQDNENVLTNQHMWSHYADGLRGYCICFDQEKLTRSLIINNEHYLASTDVTYTDVLPSIDPVEFFCGLDNRFNYAFIESAILPRLNIYSILSTKSTSWSIEKEYRILSGKRGALSYANDAIDEIVIGDKMPAEQQKLLISVIKSAAPNAKIRKATTEKNSYDIIIIDYPNL